jgi:hypothetical protein
MIMHNDKNSSHCISFSCTFTHHAGMTKSGLGLAFGEEAETFWSILGKGAPHFKYFSTSNWRLFYDLLTDNICAIRANSLPDMLLRKYKRAAALEVSAGHTLLRLSDQLDANEQFRAAALAARNDTHQGLAKRFHSSAAACDVLYPPSGVEQAEDKEGAALSQRTNTDKHATATRRLSTSTFSRRKVTCRAPSSLT